MAAVSARTPLRLLAENRDFRLLYVAQLVSFAGDWFLFVALAGLVDSLTHSPLLVGSLVAANTIPFALASIVAGPLADRVDRQRLMVGADLARAVLALGFLLIDQRSEVWLVFVLLAAISALGALFEPTSMAAVPNLVDPEDLGAANVLAGSAWGTMLAVGAGLGGIVVAAFGREAGYLGDAASFLISALLLLRIRRSFSEARETSHAPPNLVEATKETIRYSRKDHRVLALLAVKAGFGLSIGVVGILPVLALETFNAGDRGTGILYAFRGVGAFIGPFLGRAFLREGRLDRLFVGIGISLAVSGGFYVAVSAAPTFAVAVLFVFCAHLGGGTQWVLSTYGLQSIVPDRIRGRVFAFDYGLVTFTLAFSAAVGGWVAEVVGIRTGILALGCVGVGFAIAWSLLTARLRRSLRPEAAAEAV